jgi:glutamate/tyrosine decarboxylase-like PLP-dependent enzyme
MLDDMVDMLAGLRESPAWQPMPGAVRQALRSEALPTTGASLDEVYRDFQTLVQPYSSGNNHPRFMGWVQGGGNPVGMLADMLAAALNPNMGGRDHAPIEVERQVIQWAAHMLGFPADASGALVTGTSMANLIAVLVARTRALGTGVRRTGLHNSRLVAYASAEAHNCVARAMDMAGIGDDALRLIPLDSQHRMDMDALHEAVARDRAAGLQPFLVVGSAGTVDTGAVDNLDAISTMAQAQGLWFHVDAAYGALAMLSPAHRSRVEGLRRADSVAFDFHKWAQVPYDAGCLIVRDASLHAATFASQPAYLLRQTRGLAGNHPWPTDFGPDLSRGFRALKVWMTLKTYGTDKLGQVVAQSCSLAQALARRVDALPLWQRVAPVSLNVVCFRLQGTDLPPDTLDALHADLVADVHESGAAVPSTTRIGGRLCIRVALVNHRTVPGDLDVLLDALHTAVRQRMPSLSFA